MPEPHPYPFLVVGDRTRRAVPNSPRTRRGTEPADRPDPYEASSSHV